MKKGNYKRNRQNTKIKNKLTVNCKQLRNLFKTLDFLMEVPLSHRKSVFFKGFQIDFTSNYVFVTSQRENYVFVGLENVKEHLKEQLQ